MGGRIDPTAGGKAGGSVREGGSERPPRGIEADVERVLISAEAIAARVASLAEEISRALTADGAEAEGIVLVPVMTGSILFAADLVRHLPHRLRLQLAMASSYPGTATTSQGVQLVLPLPTSLAGRHVLLLDDILDSGRTLLRLRSEIEAQGPASVRSVVLLRKDLPISRMVPCEHVGFAIPDEFVVGYGLDFDGFYRNLPYIGTLRRPGPHAD